MSDFKNVFIKIFTENNLQIYNNDECISSFEKLYDTLVETNKLFNLTAVTEMSEVVALHFADSLMINKYILQNSSVLDVWSCAGFPSLPLAITNKTCKINALDSTQKKMDFANSTAKLLGLNNYNAFCGRAEALSQGENRENYDFVCARAVARLNVLCEICMPFVKVGGHFLAMKGSQGEAECEEAENAIKALGGELVSVDMSTLITPKGEQSRSYILIKKVQQTVKKYPRNYSQISKKPL